MIFGPRTGNTGFEALLKEFWSRENVNLPFAPQNAFWSLCFQGVWNLGLNNALPRKGTETFHPKLWNDGCFGYKKNSEGNLEPDDEQAEIVKKIYELYLSGISINGIISILAEENILSPQGSNKWSKKTISIILTNGKYTGSVQVLKSDPNRSSYCMLNAHEAIISGEDFARVQEEMYRRARKKPKYESTAIALIKNEDWIKQISQTKGEDTVD